MTHEIMDIQAVNASRPQDLLAAITGTSTQYSVRFIKALRLYAQTSGNHALYDEVDELLEFCRSLGCGVDGEVTKPKQADRDWCSMALAELRDREDELCDTLENVKEGHKWYLNETQRS